MSLLEESDTRPWSFWQLGCSTFALRCCGFLSDLRSRRTCGHLRFSCRIPCRWNFLASLLRRRLLFGVPKRYEKDFWAFVSLAWEKLSCTSRLTSLVQVSYKFSVRLGGPPEASSARLFNMNSGVFHSPSRFFKFTLPLKAALPVWPLSCVDPLAVRGTPSWIPLKNWLFRLEEFVLFLTAQWIVKASKCHMLHSLQLLTIFGGGGGGGGGDVLSTITISHLSFLWSPTAKSLFLRFNFAISTLVLYLGILSPSRIFHSLRQICRPPAAVPSLSPLLPVVLEHVIGHWVLSAGDAWRTMRLAPTTISKSAYDSMQGMFLFVPASIQLFLNIASKTVQTRMSELYYICIIYIL